MVNTQRKSTTSHARILLHTADALIDGYRMGSISDREVRQAFQRALDDFVDHARENFLLRVENSRFFRDPVPEHADDAVPVKSAEGR